MTILELIHQEVTARQVAELYGLKIDRSGRGFCPWHDDGKHAALQFFNDGQCYCHSCHSGGDATDIAMQMLGLGKKEAAERLKEDFHLDQPVNKRPDPSTKIKRKQRQTEKRKMDKRWDELCKLIHDADEMLEQYRPETIDENFVRILRVRCNADQELNLLWEAFKEMR